MSTWTHVVGAVRIDGLPKLSSRRCSVENVQKIFGKMWLPYAEQPVGDDKECTVPKGSEGSLQYRVIIYDDGLPWAIVAVWGDLRDFNDDHAIIQWFEEACQTCQKESLLVRDGVIQIQVSHEDAKVLRWDDDHNCLEGCI